MRNVSELPLHLGIVLLASKQKFDQEQAAAIELAQKVFRPGQDEAFVLTAGGDKPWPNQRLDWLRDASAVSQAVRALDKNAGLPDAFNYQISTSSAGLSRSTVESYGGAKFSVFDIIWAMMKNDPRPARRAVVIFRLASAHSPGFSLRSKESSDDQHTNIIRVAQSLGISFYTVGIEEVVASNTLVGGTEIYAPTHSGAGGATRVYDQNMDLGKERLYAGGRHNVDRIADETGGRSWWTARKNYSDAVAGIASELAGRYLVIFTPADSASGPVRPLKVQVSGAAHVSAPHACIVPQGKTTN